MVPNHSLDISANVMIKPPFVKPGDQSTVQDCALPTVHGGQWLPVWRGLQFCTWPWRGEFFPYIQCIQHFTAPNLKHFSGAQCADEPGSAEPKLQRVPLQVFHDHRGM